MTYYTYGPSWSHIDDPSYLPTAQRPAPPRHPLLAELTSKLRDDGLLPKEVERSDDVEEFTTYSCWRLRACALCLTLAMGAQAAIVGGEAQRLFEHREVDLLGLFRLASPLTAPLLLLLLLAIALFSLLSQLLLWSDSAVMRVPSKQRLWSSGLSSSV